MITKVVDSILQSSPIKIDQPISLPYSQPNSLPTFEVSRICSGDEENSSQYGKEQVSVKTSKPFELLDSETTCTHVGREDLDNGSSSKDEDNNLDESLQKGVSLGTLCVCFILNKVLFCKCIRSLNIKILANNNV